MLVVLDGCFSGVGEGGGRGGGGGEGLTGSPDGAARLLVGPPMGLPVQGAGSKLWLPAAAALG